MSVVVCPGCGSVIDKVAETTDQVDILKWGARKPHRQIERSTLYCPSCERVLATSVRDVTPAEETA